MKLKLALITVVALAIALAGFATSGTYTPAMEPGVAHAAEDGDAALAGTYSIDPNHSSIYFDITHLGLSIVNGRFDKFEGKIVADPQNVGNSSVSFTADASSINTGIEARDNHLRTADFFDVEKYPTLEFKSTDVRAGRDSYILSGDLTMHGVTKPVEIEFRLRGPHTMPGRDGKPVTRIGVIAEPLVIKRSDFGISNTDPMPDGTLALSDEVNVRISFEAIKDDAASS